ncbi:hypothetical protein IFM89_016556 [Coptis chinensis]|uniref:phosphatidate cytidylyltransferase n=1 Tax=Coptis chinensis TaxID=261450 RepID=A0A835IBS8_9MAGN|nr:hypothetical protein IFM89_016556 [Coptis chinensis]
MTSCIEIDRCNVIPLTLTSLCGCKNRPLSNTLFFKRQSCTTKFNLRLVSNVSKRRNIRFCIATDGQILEPLEPVSGNDENEEVSGSSSSHGLEKNEEKLQGSQLKKRVVFGLAIGLGVAGVVLAGGWIFTVALSATVFVGAREYFELVRSRGIASGMTPPPRYVSRACSVICALMPLLTL